MANTFKIILFSFSMTILLTAALPAQELAGFAVLPAETFTSGPTSGQFINSANGVAVPFAQRQPVQGFSSVLNIGGSKFPVMSDNGFGSKEDSPDFLLHVYEITPDFKTASGGTGTISVKSLFVLSDPDHHLNFPIVADSDFYAGGEKKIPVDPAIREGRLLTGADLDIESFRRMPDGTFGSGMNSAPSWFIPTAAAESLIPRSRWRESCHPKIRSWAITFPTLNAAGDLNRWHSVSTERRFIPCWKNPWLVPRRAS